MTEKITTKKARWLRRLACVPRWATVPVVHRQNVAEHSFHVIVLCRWLLPLHVHGADGNFELAVLRAAIDHDADEAQSGDIPSTYKTRNLGEEIDQVEAVVKCADKLEALLYVMEEMKMGNRLGIEELYQDVLSRFFAAWENFKAHPSCGKIAPSQIVESASRIVYNREAPHPSMEKERYAD